jgi:hypothetical protein
MSFSAAASYIAAMRICVCKGCRWVCEVHDDQPWPAILTPPAVTAQACYARSVTLPTRQTWGRASGPRSRTKVRSSEVERASLCRGLDFLGCARISALSRASVKCPIKMIVATINNVTQTSMASHLFRVPDPCAKCCASMKFQSKFEDALRSIDGWTESLVRSPTLAR